jgi:hypothetical protein
MQTMVRSKKKLTDPNRYRTVNFGLPTSVEGVPLREADVAGPSHVYSDPSHERNDDAMAEELVEPVSAPNFNIVCPCTKCEGRPRPWKRRYDVVLDHLRTHLMGTRHRVC